ncbi:MAG: hypothetical protein R3D58_14950 [Saprospiraceae bacterium]|nr:hypothetical protein [Lewinellaceae bacterium]
MKQPIFSIAIVLTAGLFAAFSLLPKETTTVDTRTDKDFQKFLKQFPETILPYAITKEQMLEPLETQDDENMGNNPGPRKRLEDPKRFIPIDQLDYISRVPIYKEPVARMATARHNAVIYSVSQGYSRPFKSFYVAVFNKNGTFVNSRHLAGSGITYVTAGTIDMALSAVVETYKVHWEKDRYDAGLADNAITGLTLESSEIVDLTKPTEKHPKGPKIKPLIKEEPNVKTVGVR